MHYVGGGLLILCLLMILGLLFRIWQEGRRERLKPRQIPGDQLPEELRTAALRPLSRLNDYYARQDPDQADACLDETMLPEEMLILGTCPGEIFGGRKWSKHLLQSDWKYWGKLKLQVESTALSRVGTAMYFVLPAQVRLNYIFFRIPIRITGVLEERDGRWYISKMQFINNLNTAYLLVAWVPALGLVASLALLALGALL